MWPDNHCHFKLNKFHFIEKKTESPKHMLIRYKKSNQWHSTAYQYTMWLGTISYIREVTRRLPWFVQRKEWEQRRDSRVYQWMEEVREHNRDTRTIALHHSATNDRDRANSIIYRIVIIHFIVIHINRKNRQALRSLLNNLDRYHLSAIRPLRSFSILSSNDVLSNILYCVKQTNKKINIQYNIGFCKLL